MNNYKDMYHMVKKFKGCTSVLISVRGIVYQTTLNNQLTADYVNYYFWGMSSKARDDLLGMNEEDDLICIRMSTSYYECTVTVGSCFRTIKNMDMYDETVLSEKLLNHRYGKFVSGVPNESDFMIFVTQKTPTNINRPLYHFRKLVQGNVPCEIPQEQDDPVTDMKKALVQMTEKVQDVNLSPYERRKIAYLSAAEMSGVDKVSTTSMAGDLSKKKATPSVAMSSIAIKDESVSKPVTSKSRISNGSSVASSMVSVGSDGTRTKSGTKWSIGDGSKSGSRQLASLREKKYQLLRKERYDWIKIDKDDLMVPPEMAPLYERTTSEGSLDDEDDIGYWRKKNENTFTIFAPDGSVIQDEVTIGFKPCSGSQFPPRKWLSKKTAKEMVFKRKKSTLEPFRKTMEKGAANNS